MKVRTEATTGIDRTSPPKSSRPWTAVLKPYSSGLTALACGETALTPSHAIAGPVGVRNFPIWNQKVIRLA